MNNDIVIAGLMLLGSVVWLAAIVALIARATRDEPSTVRHAETLPALRAASGW